MAHPYMIGAKARRYRVDLRIKGLYCLRFVYATSPEEAKKTARIKYNATDVISVMEV